MDNITSQITEYASNAKFEDLTAEAIHAAAQRLIDSLGCALGAYDSEPVQIGRRLAQWADGGKISRPRFVFWRPIARRSGRLSSTLR